MEKLNEVKQALKYLEIDAKAYADNFSASMIVSTKNILAIAAAFRKLEQRLNEDTMRMDWLVSKTVNVREPLRYGSRDLFWSEAVTDEEDDHHATLLRQQIDAAIDSEARQE